MFQTFSCCDIINHYVLVRSFLVLWVHWRILSVHRSSLRLRPLPPPTTAPRPPPPPAPPTFTTQTPPFAFTTQTPPFAFTAQTPPPLRLHRPDAPFTFTAQTHHHGPARPDPPDPPDPIPPPPPARSFVRLGGIVVLAAPTPTPSPLHRRTARRPFVGRRTRVPFNFKRAFWQNCQNGGWVWTIIVFDSQMSVSVSVWS